MWTGVPTLIAGLPSSLGAFAKWRQVEYGIDINVTESIKLVLNPDTKDWSGASTDVGDNLYVDVCSLETPNRYDVSLCLRSGKTIVDSVGWHNIFIADVRPFDTGHLTSVRVAGKWYMELHARG